jgi:hypothetical protein
MPRKSVKTVEQQPDLPGIPEQRAAAAGRRRPPGSPPTPPTSPSPKKRPRRPKLPLMMSLPSPAIEAKLPERPEPEPGDVEVERIGEYYPVPSDKPVYHARFTKFPRAIALELGTDEDWCELERHVRAVEAKAIPPEGVEIWGQVGDLAVRVWPNPDPRAQAVMEGKFRNAAARTTPLFAPEYHPGYTEEQAKADQQRVWKDYETRYKKAMGLLVGPPGVDGPVTRELVDDTRPRVRAGPLDEANVEGIKAIFGVDLSHKLVKDPLPDVT